jgi:hypothetical protein
MKIPPAKLLKGMSWKLILLEVLYGCETWSVMLKEEHTSRVFDNRVLRRIFGPKRVEVTGGRKNCLIMSLIIRTLRQIY